MKTFKFKLWKYTVTVTIEKKRYKTKNELEAELEARLSEVCQSFDKNENRLSSDDIMEILGYQSEPVVKEPVEEFKMEAPAAEKEPYGEFHIIRDWFADYVDTCRARGTYSESTLRSYEGIYRNHLQSLMEFKLPGKLSEEIVQAAFDEEITKGLSKKTLQSYRSLVLKVFLRYLDWEPTIRITPEKESTDENA